MKPPKKQQTKVNKNLPEAYRTGELPDACELAKIAAPFLCRQEQQHRAAVLDAIQSAARLYLACAEFLSEYQKAGPEQRAIQVGDTNAVLLAAARSEAKQIPLEKDEIRVPSPMKVPASFDDFLAIVVNKKTPADSLKSFRDFLRSACPDGINADDHAERRIGTLRKQQFAHESIFEWDRLGREYLVWKSNDTSQKRSIAGKTPKKKRENT